MNPKELIVDLSNDKLFLDWNIANPGNFLSHFFCQINEEFSIKSNWEIGYYINGFEIKPADDIFKKPGDKVEKLDLSLVKISFDKAIEIAKAEFPKQFPGEPLGGGFLILQYFKDHAVWNFTFITKRIKFVNLKINAEDGTIVSHNTVNLIQQGNRSEQS